MQDALHNATQQFRQTIAKQLPNMHHARHVPITQKNNMQCAQIVPINKNMWDANMHHAQIAPHIKQHAKSRANFAKQVGTCEKHQNILRNHAEWHNMHCAQFVQHWKKQPNVCTWYVPKYTMHKMYEWQNKTKLHDALHATTCRMQTLPQLVPNSTLDESTSHHTTSTNVHDARCVPIMKKQAIRTCEMYHNA